MEWLRQSVYNLRGVFLIELDRAINRVSHRNQVVNGDRCSHLLVSAPRDLAIRSLLFPVSPSPYDLTFSLPSVFL